MMFENRAPDTSHFVIVGMSKTKLYRHCCLICVANIFANKTKILFQSFNILQTDEFLHSLSYFVLFYFTLIAFFTFLF
jgi:hypothetical protein